MTDHSAHGAPGFDPVAFANWVRTEAPPITTFSVTSHDQEWTSILAARGADGGIVLKSLAPFVDAIQLRPKTRTGTATMLDLASFIAHVRRFQNPNSALFANNDRKSPSIQAVIDYHDAPNPSVDISPLEGAAATDLGGTGALPRACSHRASYAFPLSEEWKAWDARNKVPMSQGDFAEFLEDRIGDVIAPPVLGDGAVSDKELYDLSILLGGSFAGPSKLLELSRGLKLHQEDKVASGVNITTGEIQVAYETSHKDGAGAPLKVPSLFLIAIPVFVSGPLYRVIARLRYRVANGTIRWHYDLYRTEKVFDHAFGEAVGEARDKTGLPLFIGSPEKS